MGVDDRDKLCDVSHTIQGVDAILFCIAMALDTEELITEPYLAKGIRLLSDTMTDCSRKIDKIANGGYGT